MRTLLALALVALATPAAAEPMGSWRSGWGQGVTEYGIKNDSAGSDHIYIACSDDDGASVRFSVGGAEAPKRGMVIVTIGADEFELQINKSGHFPTMSRVDAAIFDALWTAIRKGQVMRVRLSTGQSTLFTLRGAAKVLPPHSCDTGASLGLPVDPDDTE